jgi:nitroreductase
MHTREVAMTKTLERPLSVLDAIYTRRSIRDYEPVVIERSTVRGLLDAAVQAPTGIHAQPWLFAIVQNSAVLKTLSDRAKEIWARERGNDYPLPLVEGLQSAFVSRLTDPTFNIFYNAGTLIVICARETNRFIAADCWLAAENLMLAAGALGLGTCCIGAATAAINTAEGKSALGIPSDVTAVVPIIVGVPRGAAAPVSRHDPLIVAWQ